MTKKIFCEESAFARRNRLFDFVEKGFLGKELLDELLPEGKAHDYEKQLWDYKTELPSIPTGVKLTIVHRTSLCCFFL